MRKKLKKYNNGGFIPELLNTLNAVPGLDGSSLPGFGQLNIGAGSTSDGVLLNAMQSYAGKTVPSDLMGQYRRGSINSAMNGGLPGQFGFMNNFMQQNQLGQFAPQPQINTDPFQFMPQVGFSAQQEADMDAADRALQPTGPINTMGPQLGLPANPNVNMQPAPIINPGTVTSSTYGMHAKPTSLTASPTPSYTVSNPKMNDGISSGMGGVDQTQSLLTSIAGEANEFDQAASVLNKGKNVIGTLKKVVGEDVFKSHAAKLASKLPGKVGEKIAGKVATSALEGAGTKFGSFLGSNAGAAASLGVGLLGKGIQSLDKKDGNYSTAGAMGGGALQGAAIGSMLGPIGTVIGGALGAGVGALQKRKFDHNAEMEALAEKSLIAKDNARTRLQSKQILANVPTQGIKEQVFEDGGKTPARKKYTPEGDQITLDMISQYMTDTRSAADDPYDFSAAMDTIAYHESGMDPQRYQMDSGPGRGMVQYDEPSALAASNRLRDLAKLWNKPNPKWNTPEGTKNFAELTIEQQKMLWMADKLMDKTVDLAALGMREEPLVDFWADHHWRGKDKDRATRQLSFESHRLPAKAFGLPEYKAEYKAEKNQDPAQQQITPTLDLPGMFLTMPPIEPSNFEADTVKMKFENGGLYSSNDPKKKSVKTKTEKTLSPEIGTKTPSSLDLYNDSLYLYELTKRLKDQVPSFEDVGKGSKSSFFKLHNENRMVPQEQTFLPLRENRHFNLSEIPGYENSDIIVSALGDEQNHAFDTATTPEELKRFKQKFIDGQGLTHYELYHPSIKPTGIYSAEGGTGFSGWWEKSMGRDPWSSYNATYDKPKQKPVKDKIEKTLTASNQNETTPQRPRVVIPEPLTPLGVGRNQTPKRDILIKKDGSKSTGRKPELMMRSNPRMRTGQEPNYYKVWDNKRKQWTTRPVEPEELERYRKENKIIEPIVTPPISFELGGHTNDPDYIAEGGEVIQHAPGDIPKTDMNGGTKKISNTVRKITGDKHSAPSGGVGMSQEDNAFIYSDKLRISKDLQNLIYNNNGKLRF